MGPPIFVHGVTLVGRHGSGRRIRQADSGRESLGLGQAEGRDLGSEIRSLVTLRRDVLVTTGGEVRS